MPLADAANLRAKDRGVWWNGKTGQLSDLVRGLTDAVRIHGPVGQDQQFAQGFLLRVGGQIRLMGLKRLQNAAAKRLLRHDSLLTRTYGSVVKGFADHNLGYGILE